ncbi:ankyrin [Amniculicola lignicola CBS 123094]|uniref:Ankyrin n=1 Tax=Amniculicola lignicola CBS 123094 TaxID=1392246 RepID=A0A6A5WGN1_9PLEO|nr:ankyrin [Amniculicola lignicola CBS 123094]
MGLFSERTLNVDLRNTDPSETQTIQSLLARGADPNTTHKHGKPTPLVQAAAAGIIPTIKVLLDAGANINKVDGRPHRQTPLIAAVSTNQTDVVEYLLSRGAKINGVMHIPPLWELLEAKSLTADTLRMLQFLLDKDADPDIHNIIYERPVKHLVRQFCGWHSMQKAPKSSCKDCQRRPNLLLAIVMLRHYGAKPIEKAYCGAGLEEVYSDILAYFQKQEERGERAAKWLWDCTLGDPMIQTLVGWGLMGVVGSVTGLPGPATSLSGLMGLPEFKDKRGRNIYP